MKLDEGNIPNYLKNLKIFNGVDWSKAKANEIKEYTNVNFVFCVQLNSKKYKKVYLKQAFDFVKISPDFPAPLDRQLFEKLSIEYLQQYWGRRIPRVIYYDKDSNVLIITDIGKEAVLLADEIKKGKLHFEIGSDLGTMMAQLHSPTFYQNNYPVRDKQANNKHVEFIFDFRLRGAREIIPIETQQMFKESKQAKSSMIYGDWASKNVFVVGNKIKLVDFENLVRFDPAFDIGYALAHWVLDISKENQTEMIKFFQDFEKTYVDGWETTEEVIAILKRATKYIGAMMLHRLAGVKNTNRMEEYLNKDVPLIEIAKQIVFAQFSIPSTAIGNIKLK